MMEQPQGRMGKHDLMFVRRLDAFLIHHAPTRRSKVLHTTFPRPMHVVSKREKRVTRARDPIQLERMLCSLFGAQGHWHLSEQTLPMSLLSSLKNLRAHEEVDGISFFGALDSSFEGEGEHPWVVTEPPVVSFGAGKTRAVDTGLLACTKTNDRATQRIRDAVRLGVF